MIELPRPGDVGGLKPSMNVIERYSGIDDHPDDFVGHVGGNRPRPGASICCPAPQLAQLPCASIFILIIANQHSSRAK